MLNRWLLAQGAKHNHESYGHFLETGSSSKQKDVQVTEAINMCTKLLPSDLLELTL
jgi:hypothetical protein